MKKVAIIVLMTMFLGIMCAEMVDESLATTVALRFFENMSKATGVVHSIKGYSSFDTPDPDFYIVNFEPKGFVLVAADQRSQPILAFSTDFTFPHEDIPESIQHFISAYSKGMSEIRRHPEWKKDPNWANITSMNFSHYESRNSVEPMIETVWSQRWPYHLLCPEDPGSPGGRVRVGTMATAMGQIMKKWNYPHRGQGSNTYNAVGYGEQSANFGATIYNWQDMPDSVATENLSVATLLYHCGVAVNMRYGTDYSIADTYDARDALVNHFRYHDNAEIMYYVTFAGDLISWRNRLRDELAVGRPLIYHAISAARDDGFILDGYRAEDYFHINWGWGGDRNGYYLLNNLNPGTANYYTDHQAIVNIYPQSHPENDLAAVKLSGNKFPNIDEQNSYRVRVVNSGLEIQDNYLVQLYLEDGTLIDQIAGEIILPQGVLEYDLNWTPDAQGQQIIYAKVQMDSDQDNDNDRSNDLIINVLGEDSILIETGDDDSFNNLSSQPSPYVSNVRLFRQQYLLLSTELSAAGANAGMLEALSFNVRYKHYCAPMPNYRIRFKHTDLNSLNSTFEPGDYQTVCQYDYYMPVEGWNTHLFDEPFIWDGLSNVIVDILTDQIVENIGDNASVYYTDTSFSSSLRCYHNDATSSEFSSGYVRTSRPNMKLHYNSINAGTVLLVNPSVIDFGELIFGETYGPRYINLVNISGETITISDNDFSLSGSDQFAFDSSLFPIVLEPMETLAFPVTITGVQEGVANATMSFYCAGEEHEVELSADVWEENLVYIGNGSLNSGIPVMADHDYSYSQFLYMPHEIMFARRQIEKIAFYWNGGSEALNTNSWDIYMGHTNDFAFQWAGGWIPLDELSQVYQGSITLPAQDMWIEIELDTPFTYNGTSNLAIAIHENQPGSDDQAGYFYNTESRSCRSIHYTDGTSQIDPANPADGTLKTAYPNIKMHFGDPTSIEDDITSALKLTGLKSNYPNPFNPETTVSYSLAEAGHAQINIYNLKGQLVRRLLNSEMVAGEHEVIWKGHDDHNREVSSGVYFIRLNAGKHSSTKKMIMMK